MRLRLRFRFWDGGMMWWPDDAVALHETEQLLDRKGNIIWYNETEGEVLNSNASPITMLSTNRYDENNREMFDQDIIKGYDDIRKERGEFLLEYIVEHAAFMMWHFPECTEATDLNNIKRHQIIGNRYENPELLPDIAKQ